MVQMHGSLNVELYNGKCSTHVSRAAPRAPIRYNLCFIGSSAPSGNLCSSCNRAGGSNPCPPSATRAQCHKSTPTLNTNTNYINSTGLLYSLACRYLLDPLAYMFINYKFFAWLFKPTFTMAWHYILLLQLLGQSLQQHAATAPWRLLQGRPDWLPPAWLPTLPACLSATQNTHSSIPHLGN
jgi:hypothetical protein